MRFRANLSMAFLASVIVLAASIIGCGCGGGATCGRGTTGSNCLSTNDCACGLQCIAYVCITETQVDGDLTDRETWLDGDATLDGETHVDTEKSDGDATDGDIESVDGDTVPTDGDIGMDQDTTADDDFGDEGDAVPDGDQCVPISHVTAQCYQGDVWWYDSCGNREDKKSRCDPSGCLNAACISSSKFSCVDGICTDLVRGFEWQQTPAGERDGYMNWHRAISQCQHLDLDGSGWRLPTISELRSLIKGCADTELYHSSTQCGIYDDCLTCWNDECLGCSSNEGPANGCYWKEGLDGTCSGYWSSSLPSLPGIDASNAWSVIYNSAKIYNFNKYNSNYVRCVRCCVP